MAPPCWPQVDERLHPPRLRYWVTSFVKLTHCGWMRRVT